MPPLSDSFGGTMTTAVCTYEQHRRYDWRHGRGSPLRKEIGDRWTCGVCHPPPYEDEYMVNDGYGNTSGPFHLEWSGGRRPPRGVQLTRDKTRNG